MLDRCFRCAVTAAADNDSAAFKILYNVIVLSQRCIDRRAFLSVRLTDKYLFCGRRELTSGFDPIIADVGAVSKLFEPCEERRCAV